MPQFQLPHFFVRHIRVQLRIDDIQRIRIEMILMPIHNLLALIGNIKRIRRLQLRILVQIQRLIGKSFAQVYTHLPTHIAKIIRIAVGQHKPIKFNSKHQ